MDRRRTWPRRERSRSPCSMAPPSPWQSRRASVATVPAAASRAPRRRPRRLLLAGGNPPGPRADGEVAAVTTELRLNASVTCADSVAGGASGASGASGAGGAREVRLRCSRRDLARTEFFTETETLPPEVIDPWSVAAAADGHDYDVRLIPA